MNEPQSFVVLSADEALTEQVRAQLASAGYPMDGSRAASLSALLELLASEQPSLVVLDVNALPPQTALADLVTSLPPRTFAAAVCDSATEEAAQHALASGLHDYFFRGQL